VPPAFWACGVAANARKIMATRVIPNDWTETLPAHILFVLGVTALGLSIPRDSFADANREAILMVGMIGLWRYSWGVTHWIRSLYYRKSVFPRMRQKADAALIAQNYRPHAYLIVTSFRIPTDTTIRVYAATFRAAVNAPWGATVICSIVEMSDQRLIRQVYEMVVGDREGVQLIFVRIQGSGKRDALAYGYRTVSQCMPRANDMVAMIDGDSIVPDDLIAKCAPFFVDPKVGALTTDEVSEVTGKMTFQRWFSMRFAQRQILMSSMGLAGRVLTLTGRMSFYRADIVCDPSFIAGVEVDNLTHWRLGNFLFLTGDDKSTWFWILKKGYKMPYVPDVIVTTIDDPPEPKFVANAKALMQRWFGNMLRNNARVLELGPKHVGYFTWWSVLDQRMSMWTSLSGLIFMVLGFIFVSPWTIAAYSVWILSSRYVQALMLFQSRPRVSIQIPLLLYFNQVYGSYVKTLAFFYLNKQKWTRQGTTLAKGKVTLKERAREWSSAYMLGLAWFGFTVGIASLMGLLTWV
jgi:mannuronan synthase